MNAQVHFNKYETIRLLLEDVLHEYTIQVSLFQLMIFHTIVNSYLFRIEKYFILAKVAALSFQSPSFLFSADFKNGRKWEIKRSFCFRLRHNSSFHFLHSMASPFQHTKFQPIYPQVKEQTLNDICTSFIHAFCRQKLNRIYY